MGASVEITKNEFAEKGASNGANRMIREACIRIAAQWKTLAAVDKGQYKNSVMTTTNYGGEELFNNESGEQAEKRISLQPENTENKKSGYVGSNSDHWYSEFGTRFQVAQPAGRPAKEIIMDGGKAGEVGKKYGREEMKKEFQKRKVTKKVVNG